MPVATLSSVSVDTSLHGVTANGLSGETTNLLLTVFSALCEAVLPPGSGPYNLLWHKACQSSEPRT